MEIHSLPHLITVLSTRKQKNTARKALVLWLEARSTRIGPIPSQPLRVPYQLVPPTKCPVGLGKFVELSGPPPEQCRAPGLSGGDWRGSWASSHMQWLGVPGSERVLNTCGRYKCMNLTCRPPIAYKPSPKLGMTRA